MGNARSRSAPQGTVGRHALRSAVASVLASLRTPPLPHGRSGSLPIPIGSAGCVRGVCGETVDVSVLPPFFYAIFKARRCCICRCSPMTQVRALGWERHSGNGAFGSSDAAIPQPQGAAWAVRTAPLKRIFRRGCELMQTAFAPFILPGTAQKAAQGLKKEWSCWNGVPRAVRHKGNAVFLSRITR